MSSKGGVMHEERRRAASADFHPSYIPVDHANSSTFPYFPNLT